MTDEQVKKGLECCGHKDFETCTLCPYDEKECNHLSQDALALINRLEEEKEQIRKEILADVLSFLWGFNNGRLDRVIDAYKEKYGVEVE